MNKFIWKFKFAWRIRHLVGIRMWRFGWCCANEALNDIDYQTECPTQAADNEVGSWYV